VGEEVHFDGEVYGAIGWDLWKAYKAAGLGQGDILADLVGGMNFTPASPNFQQMRDGILMGLTASVHDARACMVWSSFAKYGVGVGASSIVRGKKITVTESFALPPECVTP
jgi:extracellular elastinolytic metalloproteinase